jgi:hypothetical protein
VGWRRRVRRRARRRRVVCRRDRGGARHGEIKSLENELEDVDAGRVVHGLENVQERRNGLDAVIILLIGQNSPLRISQGQINTRWTGESPGHG